MLRTIAITTVAGLLVGILLPFAIFGSHEVVGKLDRRTGPRAEVDLQARQVKAQRLLPERRIPQASNYGALASTVTRDSTWRKRTSPRTRSKHFRKARRIDPPTQHRLAVEDKAAFEAADRMLRAERAGA